MYLLPIKTTNLSVVKKLIGQTAVYGLSTIVGRFMNFLLVPLYTRFFCQSDYGIVTELYSYTVFFMIFLTYGMETGFFRFSQDQQDKPNVYTTVLTSLLGSTGIFIALVAIFLHPISASIGYGGNERYIFWMAIIIAIDVITTVPFAKLRLENKAIKFAVIKFVNIGLNIGFNVLFLMILPYLAKHQKLMFISQHFATPKVSYIFISNLIASVVTLIMLLPDMLKSHNKFDYDLLKKVLAYSWPLLISGLAGSINEVYDRVSLRYFVTVPHGLDAGKYILSQVGIYGASYKLAMIISIFNQAFRYAAEPLFFSRLHEKDSRLLYAKILNYFVAFTLFLFLFIMIYIDFFKHFIGRNFYEGLNVVPILLLANIFLGIVFNLSIWYKLSNQTKFGIYIVGFGAVVTLIINLIFVPQFGYMACAWATLICYFLMTILSYILCQKYYTIPYNLKSIGLYFGLALLFYVVDKFVVIDIVTVKHLVKLMLLSIFVIAIMWNEKLYFFRRNEN